LTRKPDDHSTGLLEAFLKAGGELVAEGADGLTTTCGFLSIYQKELAAHCGVPVAASSLMQIPLVKRLLPPGKLVGVQRDARPVLQRAGDFEPAPQHCESRPAAAPWRTRSSR
jgi:hypothetical protein